MNLSFSLSSRINSGPLLSYFSPLSYNDFIPIGLNEVFTFDGDRWDIENIELVVITSSNVESYKNITYYAMFAQNSGTIKYFGLVNPTVIVATTIT